MSIRVDNLSVEYVDRGKRVRALDGIDLEIPAGQTVAVIGRSGAGKTSLLRSLAGLLEPASGEVSVAGHRIDHGVAESREFCRDVGVVFQHYGLVPQLTALQNICCGRLFDYPASGAMLRFDPEDRKRAESWLERLGLRERRNVRTVRLSGGEKQRVAIARLLLQNPRVVLLDEPISSLDIHWSQTVMEELGQLHDGNVTTVIILHDLEVVRSWADRVLLLDDGELIFDGDPEEGCQLLEERGFSGVGPEIEPASVSPGPVPGAAEPPTPSELDHPAFGRLPFYLLFTVVAIVAYIWALTGVDFSFSKFFGSWDATKDFLGRMLPPDFSVTGTILDSLIETIQMALVGTTLAAIVSLPISVMAARNVSPRPVQAVARVVLNLLRTIPSIIWGLFFVAIVGLGPFPGILALTFYASGYLGKFYYEGIESIDPAPVTALRTVGASRLQRFRYAVFPQVLPLLLGYTLYMFEYNVRAASILGIVGAGGIGFYLYSFINNFHYDKAATAIVLLLVVVTVIDSASSRIRAYLGTD